MKIRMVVAGGIAVVGALAPSAAFAVDDPYVQRPPSVPSTVAVNATGTSSGSSASVLPAVQTRNVANNTLPVTGGDMVGLTIIGLAAIGGGAVLVRRSRMQPAKVSKP